MARFIIEGHRPLNGTIVPSGNKNEVLPALTASLLTDEPIVLRRVPRIGDVATICDILKKLGVKVEWLSHDTLSLDAKSAHSFKPPRELCSKVRASILLLAPLLSRFKSVKLPLPGGDVIGARRIDTHWEGIEALGGKLEFGQEIEGHISKIVGTEIFLDEPSVTATENLLLLAVRGEGMTTLHNAASEPHVTGLCRLLNSMGAKISGLGSNRLEVKGVPRLHGAEHTIGPDFMEVGSFICLGAISGGQVTITNVHVPDLRFILKVLKRIGIEPEVGGDYVKIDGSRPLEMKKDVGGRIGTIYSGPWPAYPTDLMSVAIVAATQSHGTQIFFEKMFDGRMVFTDKLKDMGANIVLCDPHRVVVNGPSRLFGAQLNSPDVRAGMAILTAALIAQGKSEIENIYQIERGYQDIEKKLQALGAAITKVE